MATFCGLLIVVDEKICAQFTLSKSPGFQLLSNHPCSGRLRRKRAFQPLPGHVWIQLPSCAAGDLQQGKSGIDSITHHEL